MKRGYIYSPAMRNDEASAAELWDDATAGIIERTEKTASERAVIFRYPGFEKGFVTD